MQNMRLKQITGCFLKYIKDIYVNLIFDHVSCMSQMHFFTYALFWHTHSPNYCKTCSSLQELFVKEVHGCISKLGQDSSATQRRKQHADLQLKVQGLWNMAHLFEKAIFFFKNSESVWLHVHKNSLCVVAKCM